MAASSWLSAVYQFSDDVDRLHLEAFERAYPFVAERGDPYQSMASTLVYQRVECSDLPAVAGLVCWDARVCWGALA